MSYICGQCHLEHAIPMDNRYLFCAEALQKKLKAADLENSELRALLDKVGLARAGVQGEFMAVNRLNERLQNALKEIMQLVQTPRPIGATAEGTIYLVAKEALADKR